MTTAEAARRWSETWSRAWPSADVGTIAALYAPNAQFYSHPFRDRQSPEEYVRWAFEDQAEADCRFDEPVVDGERAAVAWWGAITSRDGSIQTVAGISLLRFDEDGLVVEQRDAWGEGDGRHELLDWTVGTPTVTGRREHG